MLSNADIDKHLSAMQDAEVIAVDTETTGLEVKDGTDYLMGISVAYYLGSLGIMSAYFPFRHQGENLSTDLVHRLRPILESKPLVFHNLPFDIPSLATIGIYPTEAQRLFCTQQIAHMVNEEWFSKKLDALSKNLLNDQKDSTEVDKWKHAFGWPTIPADLMDPYARHDAELTLRLFAEILWLEFRAQDLTDLWPRELAFLSLLIRIMGRGILVDQDFASMKISTGEQIMQDIVDELGYEPTPTNLYKLFFEELKLPVLSLTPGGKPCLDKKNMEQYDEILAHSDDKRARLVLEFRGWQKAVSSLYRPSLDLLSPDGRIRANFKAHGTKTGRLSCEKPNLQQIPRTSTHVWNGDAKRTFVPMEGHKLLEFDYSQLEFRLAAAYGQVESLLEIFEKNADPFIPTAIEVFGGPEFRQDAKTLTYSILYGAGQRRVSFALGISESRASDVIGRFRDLYPGIYSASSKATKLAATRGYVRYWTGRRRHFQNPEYAYKAFNSILQGGAAELVKDAMLRVDDQVCNEDCRMVLTVHDSIVIEVREEIVEQVTPKIIALMVDFPQFGVPFNVAVKEWGAHD
jgi:DNA polymerase-1